MLSRDDTYIDLITVHADDDTLTAGTITGVVLRSKDRDCGSVATVTPSSTTGVYFVSIPLAEASDPSVCILRATVTRTSDGRVTVWKSAPFRVGGVALTARAARDLAERAEQYVPPGGRETRYDLLMRAADGRVQFAGRQVYTLTAGDWLKSGNYTAPDNAGIQVASSNSAIMLTRLTTGRAANLDTIPSIYTVVQLTDASTATLLNRLTALRAGYLDSIPGIESAIGGLPTESGGLTPEQETTLNQIKAIVQAKD